MPSRADVRTIRQAVQELSCAAWNCRQEGTRPLHRAFVRRARTRPLALAYADESRPRLNRIKALTGAVALARALKSEWAGQERVGILLPPTVASALMNLASALACRVTVNLNYTAGVHGMESAVEQARLETVVTSRTFLKKADLTPPGNVRLLYLEELAEGIGAGLRVSSLLAALFFPCRRLEKLCGATRVPGPHDLVTIIFSSGSTGDPKGVMLTQFNLDSNIDAAEQVLRTQTTDRILGIMPMFHSFGYMVFWFAAKQGLALPMHPNPLDGPAVGRLVERYRVSIMLTAPTFLRIYMRLCTPGQLGSLRLVVTGAEKLPGKAGLRLPGTVRIAAAGGIREHRMLTRGLRGRPRLPGSRLFPVRFAAGNRGPAPAGSGGEGSGPGHVCPPACRVSRHAAGQGTQPDAGLSGARRPDPESESGTGGTSRATSAW